MKITIEGKISADPKDRVLALEACTRAICEEHGMDPAEGCMMLLTAAAHMHQQYARDKDQRNMMLNLAEILGYAFCAADDFFKLRPIPRDQG